MDTPTTPKEETPAPPTTPDGRAWHREYKKQKQLTAGGIVMAAVYGYMLSQCHTAAAGAVITLLLGLVPISLLWQASRD